MKELIDQGIRTVGTAAGKVVNELSSGLAVVEDKVNGLPVFMSIEKSKDHKDKQYDEKHYFVIPYSLSEYKFALYTIRSLPESAPELNGLPKRRVFHIPNEHWEGGLREYMRQSARDIVQDARKDNPSSLESLANEIDSLDKKLTYGMLVAGGMAAIFNPLLGAGIAAKALTPGVAGLLNRYGLRPTAEKLSKFQLEREIREAEERVTKEFEDSSTLRVINPILQELELALRTTEAEHDPLVDPNLANGSIPELEDEGWRELTETAVCHVYEEAFEDKRLHEKAGLGPEDIRWLKTMFLVRTRQVL